MTNEKKKLPPTHYTVADGGKKINKQRINKKKCIPTKAHAPDPIRENEKRKKKKTITKGKASHLSILQIHPW